MAWWRREQATPESDLAGELRVQLPRQRSSGNTVAPVTVDRIAAALGRREIRHLTDPEGGLMSLWERHALLFTLEGPDDEILVMQARAYATTPAEWADRAYTATNEWNHTRRFLKAYVGDPTELGTLPLYAEMQIPFVAGAHDGLLDELVDCAADLAKVYVNWLHSDAGVL